MQLGSVLKNNVCTILRLELAPKKAMGAHKESSCCPEQGSAKSRINRCLMNYICKEGTFAPVMALIHCTSLNPSS